MCSLKSSLTTLGVAKNTYLFYVYWVVYESVLNYLVRQAFYPNAKAFLPIVTYQ